MSGKFVALKVFNKVNVALKILYQAQNLSLTPMIREILSSALIQLYHIMLSQLNIKPSLRTLDNPLDA